MLGPSYRGRAPHCAGLTLDRALLTLYRALLTLDRALLTLDRALLTGGGLGAQDITERKTLEMVTRVCLAAKAASSGRSLLPYR